MTEELKEVIETEVEVLSSEEAVLVKDVIESAEDTVVEQPVSDEDKKALMLKMINANEAGMNIVLDSTKCYPLHKCISKMELMVRILRFRMNLTNTASLIDSTKLHSLLPRHLKHINILEEGEKIERGTAYALSKKERYLVAGLASIRKVCIASKIGAYADQVVADVESADSAVNHEFVIDALPENSESIVGDVANVESFDRALTEVEIQQKYVDDTPSTTQAPEL